MRDIREDLQDRAGALERQIQAYNDQLDNLIEKLKREHDARLQDVKAELEAVNKLMEVEHRRVGAGAPPAPIVQDHARHPVVPSHIAQSPAPAHHVLYRPQTPSEPELPLNDFLVRKLNDAGAMSRDDLLRLSLQEGYFADVDTADRGLHTTLLHVIKAGLIQQLPNGNFAPANVLDTIWERRAM